MDKKIFINKIKKTIVTVLTDEYGKHIGKAKCHEEDSFDEEKGKKVSLLRAKLKKALTRTKLIDKEIIELETKLKKAKFERSKLVDQAVVYNSKINDLIK